MPLCRTKSGTLRVVHEGQEYLLTPDGLELPDALAEDIRPHVNVVVEEMAVTDIRVGDTPAERLHPNPTTPRRKPRDG